MDNLHVHMYGGTEELTAQYHLDRSRLVLLHLSLNIYRGHDTFKFYLCVKSQTWHINIHKP
jgi:hypothetical protein